MASPPLPHKDLQGASRTHGGIFRGRAHGNQHNMDDFQDFTDEPLPILGKVHVYVSNSKDPADWAIASMSRQVFKHVVNPSLRTILHALSDKHSPIRSECNIFLFVLLYSSITSAHNYRIYMYEGDEWIGHGRYQFAIKDYENDEAIWTVINNEHILQLLFVCFFYICFIFVCSRGA